MDTELFIKAAYLVAAVLFIFGLKLLSSPATARRGNFLGALGMLIAVVVTLLDKEVVNYYMILVGVILGSAIGVVLARMVKMTAMPQMVGLLNGLGGAASALVASAEFFRLTSKEQGIGLDVSVSIALTILIGAVTFSGSMIAFAKLQELVQSRAVTFPLQKPVNLVLFLVIVGMMISLVVMRDSLPIFLVLLVASLVLGVLLVIPIGGADMPVVIALLNSYSGMAGTAAGFVLNNSILIIAGTLVGASGIFLTGIMCRAMNRSIFNVMFGAFGSQAAVTGVPGRDSKRPVRSVTPEDAATLLAYSRSIIVIPGYGLAAAQAQHNVRELAGLLEARGVDIKYAIHPVAGRMPGHMNVLLAEANVPYNQLYDLDAINDEFERTDVAVIIGANDVVNPAARNVLDSPIYGMPILNADKAKHIIFIKRSLSPGFAGIDNDLFYNQKTMMLFADAKDAVVKLVNAVKSV